jgi:hypothetical protein
MHFRKMQEMKELTKEQLEWCNRHLPKRRWKVNSQGRVDVKGDVDLAGLNFEKFPVPFGKISGSFNCSGCRSLTTLEGAPREVTEGFYCGGCTSLTSLEGAPQVVAGSFYCHGCTSLTTLKGAPQEVTGDFFCDGCTSLTSLEGAPQEITEDFFCRGCTSLTTLEGTPQKVEGFYCEGCTSLTTLEGAPQVVTGDFFCDECTALDPFHSKIIDDYREEELDWPTAYKLIHRPKLAKAHSLGLI